MKGGEMKLVKNLVIIDLETTGTWVEKDKIIEIGMIKCETDGKITRYVKRVNPIIQIPPSVTRLVGITNEDVKDAPKFNEIAGDVLSYIGDADLGGFNIERFDLPVLARELAEAGLNFDWRDRAIYDAQKIYHVNERRDLTAAYQFYCDKKLIDAHSALADAEATLEILSAQVEQYGTKEKSIEDLQEFEYEYSGDYFDKDRKFRWWNKELYPTFGKYARKYSIQKIANIDRPFLEWMLTRDFSDEVKEMITGVLGGRMPKYPG
jgi:DNA polymerase-3 subunit epsilon